MITICPGWHEHGHRNVIVLKPEDGGVPGTSHGMCDACQTAFDAELTRREQGQAQPKVDANAAYEEYRANFPYSDPRD